MVWSSVRIDTYSNRVFWCPVLTPRRSHHHHWVSEGRAGSVRDVPQVLLRSIRGYTRTVLTYMYNKYNIVQYYICSWVAPVLRNVWSWIIFSDGSFSPLPLLYWQRLFVDASQMSTRDQESIALLAKLLDVDEMNQVKHLGNFVYQLIWVLSFFPYVFRMIFFNKHFCCFSFIFFRCSEHLYVLGRNFLLQVTNYVYTPYTV